MKQTKDTGKHWSDLFTTESLTILDKCREFGMTHGIAVSGDLVLLIAGKMAYTPAMGDSDLHALEQMLLHDQDGCPGEYDQKLSTLLGTIANTALAIGRKARVEHMLGAIAQNLGLPHVISHEAGQALSAYITIWEQWRNPNSARTPQRFNAIATMCNKIQDMVIPIYVPRPIPEREVIRYHNVKHIAIVGPKGTGKSTLMYQCGRVIAAHGRNVYDLDKVKAQFGARMRGDFEDKLYNLVQEMRKIGGVLLIDDMFFVDEAHGSATNSTTSLTEVLMTAYNQRVPVIMTMSDTKWEQLSQIPAFRKSAHLVRIPEASDEFTNQIVTAYAKSIQDASGVMTPPDVCAEVIRLAKRYRNQFGMPMGAVDLLYEAARMVDASAPPVVMKSMVTERISITTGIPMGTLSVDEKDTLLKLDASLKEVVRGQDEAVDIVCKAIRRNRAGFGEAHRPAGSFLFLGPTGVGKTETARQLARLLYAEKFHRIDMSEYSEQHSVSKLLGSPPGYIGYGEGGRLANILAKDPYCLILLDEIEKAHPNVWNLFLQVFEEGCITDSRGHKSDATNAVFIMTSNVGGFEFKPEEVIGFRADARSQLQRLESIKTKAKKAMKDVFPPEFINRLDGIVVFNLLDKSLFPDIAENMMNDLRKRMAEVGMELTWTPAVLTLLADKGFSDTDGARPMKRVVRTALEDLIADAVLKDKPEKVHIRVKAGEFIIDVKEDPSDGHSGMDRGCVLPDSGGLHQRSEGTGDQP